MAHIHGAYLAYTRAKIGKYPSFKTKAGRAIKARFRAIDETYPDEILSAELQALKRYELRPAIVFVTLHPGYTNGEDGMRFTLDFKRMQNRIDKHLKRLELATDGHSDTSVGLYERMRNDLLEAE